MKEDKKQMLKHSLREHRNNFDHINNIYDQLRIKALALIAGEVAIVTFLFSGWDFKKAVFDNDRTLVFATGILFLSLAFGIFLWIISTVQWSFPHNLKSAKEILTDKNISTEDEFLEYIHDDFVIVNGRNNSIVTSKCKKFNWSVYLLSAGVIIIMVIKFGGPQAL